jgi:hypothetical protein
MEKIMSCEPQGYLYVSTGRKYVDEAIRSAESLKGVSPYANITLVTDQEPLTKIFDTVIIDPIKVTNWREGLAYKVKHIYRSSPYEKTFFVDSDTYFYENCESLFELLEYFDLCMALAHGDTCAARSNGKRIDACYPYNTGIMLYRKHEKNASLFDEWQSIYSSYLDNDHLIGKESDQTALMEALLKSDSRVYVLPDIWNARTPCYLSLHGSVKVVHGRHKDYEQLKKVINSSQRMRSWDPSKKRCHYYDEPKIIVKLKEYLKEKLPITRQIYEKFFVTFEKRGISTNSQ